MSTGKNTAVLFRQSGDCVQHFREHTKDFKHQSISELQLLIYKMKLKMPNSCCIYVFNGLGVSYRMRLSHAWHSRPVSTDE